MDDANQHNLSIILKSHGHVLRQQIPADVSVALHKLPSIKVVLFDIYGTLFLSGAGEVGALKEHYNTSAFVEALQAIQLEPNVNVQNISDLYLRLIDESHNNSRQKGIDFPEIDIVQIMNELVNRLFEKNWVKGLRPQSSDITRLCVEYESRINPVYPMPDLIQTLQDLTSKNIRLGLISNAQFYTPLLFQAFLGQTTEELGFLDDLTVYSYILGIAKPSIDIYKIAINNLARLNIRPEETLYVGNDMLNDIYPASSLDIHTCLFAGDVRSYRPRRDNPLCAALTPDVTITHLTQLKQCL